MTVEEYLAAEVGVEIKSEFSHGILYPMGDISTGMSWAGKGKNVLYNVEMMAGGTDSHDSISLNLTGELRTRLRGSGCRAHGPNMKVQTTPKGQQRYPDASVICGEPKFREEEQKKLTLMNPRVVFEVMSDSTSQFDRREKFREYIAMPSVEEIVLIEQDLAHVQTFLRQDDGTWSMKAWSGIDAVAKLRSLDIDLPLAELYENVEFPEDELAEDDATR
jgi:Uma2 family endonuclease